MSIPESSPLQPLKPPEASTPRNLPPKKEPIDEKIQEATKEAVPSSRDSASSLHGHKFTKALESPERQEVAKRVSKSSSSDTTKSTSSDEEELPRINETEEYKLSTTDLPPRRKKGEEKSKIHDSIEDDFILLEKTSDKELELPISEAFKEENTDSLFTMEEKSKIHDSIDDDFILLEKTSDKELELPISEAFKEENTDSLFTMEDEGYSDEEIGGHSMWGAYSKSSSSSDEDFTRIMKDSVEIEASEIVDEEGLIENNEEELILDPQYNSKNIRTAINDVIVILKAKIEQINTAINDFEEGGFYDLEKLKAEKDKAELLLSRLSRFNHTRPLFKKIEQYVKAMESIYRKMDEVHSNLMLNSARWNNFKMLEKREEPVDEDGNSVKKGLEKHEQQNTTLSNQFEKLEEKLEDIQMQNEQNIEDYRAIISAMKEAFTIDVEKGVIDT